MTTARNTVLFGAALVAATAAIAVDHANHPVPRAQAPVAGQVQGGLAPCAAGAPQLAAPPPPPAQAPCAAGAPCAASPAPAALRAPPPPPAPAPAPQLAAPPPPPATLPDPEAEAPDLVVD